MFTSNLFVLLFFFLMAQGQLFDPNLRRMWALNWPKSQLFTPTCTKYAPNMTHYDTLKA